MVRMFIREGEEEGLGRGRSSSVMRAWQPQPVPGGALELKLSGSCLTLGKISRAFLSSPQSVVGYGLPPDGCDLG